MSVLRAGWGRGGRGCGGGGGGGGGQVLVTEKKNPQVFFPYNFFFKNVPGVLKRVWGAPPGAIHFFL